LPGIASSDFTAPWVRETADDKGSNSKTKYMEKDNLELSGQDQVAQPESGQSQEGQDAGTAKTGEGESAPTPLETVKLLGREYNLSNPDQVRELARDYDRLGRMYSPLTQQLAELEAQLKSIKEQPQTDYSDPETVEYLRKLGFVQHSELSQKEEDQELAYTLQELEKVYDGKDGRPRFDRTAVIEFCLNNGISSPEGGYKLMNWDALKEWELRRAKTAPAAPPSFGGEGGQRQPQPKKRVFGPTGEGEVSLRDAMLETLEQETPKVTA
jgi:hypothetical protein